MYISVHFLSNSGPVQAGLKLTVPNNVQRNCTQTCFNSYSVYSYGPNCMSYVHTNLYTLLCLGNPVVSVMDSHSRDRGSILEKAYHVTIRYALHNTQFISDESPAELVLYLCK